MNMSKWFCLLALLGCLLAVRTAHAEDAAKADKPEAKQATDDAKSTEKASSKTKPEDKKKSAKKADKKTSKKKAEAPTGPVTPGNIRQIIKLLADEGKQAVKDDFKWPRKKSDYAQTEIVSLESDEVIKQLGRSLDRNPAVDGYIKNQLLSFKPDVAGLKPNKAGRLISGMRAYVPNAQPSKRDLALLLSYKKKRKANAATRHRATTLHAQLKEAQKKVDQANKPLREYRKALIAQLPVVGGVRLMAQYQELEDQINAGVSGKKIESTLKEFAAECKKMSRDPKLPSGIRKALSRRLLSLPNAGVQTISDVSAQANGDLVVKIGSSGVKKDKLAAPIAYLAGKEPPAKKK